ncbi:NAD-dependent succinate-semialdehyde dehydrogenase [Sciscionella sediminilitoris]|uniref:NAD-dependent succinate-semialdehyde dehydrogenase n=1 Tax=Sciscionella sediminilitoris TaxID=1445613 RepID=UPI0004DF2EA1|nr:NAD-dependent succinate-semialdehyde dehydrogenase [Sciscionella sp. SE31]
MPIDSINPTTGQVLRTFEPLDRAGIQQAIDGACKAFDSRRSTSAAERARQLRAIGSTLEQDTERLARLATEEMGKTIGAARSEVAKAAAGCYWYAEHGPDLLADEPWTVQRARAFTRYQPLGPILAIMPWNFPYWQVFRFAAPALLAGNTVLLKHASNVPQCALAIEEIVAQAGCGDGVLTTMLISSSEVDAVIADERVRGVTLTGSEAAGSAVAAAAGRHIKPTVLELGGADPFVVLPSADLDRAVSAAVNSRILNNGQSCINAKRFVVHKDIAEEFLRRLTEQFKALRVGDPMDAETELGPLSSQEAVRTLHRQVTDTVAAGAQLVTGGTPVKGAGNFYPPTVLREIPLDSPGHREEFFGPVALVWQAASVSEALSIANDSPYGLGASVWTTDEAEQQRCIDEIEAGMVYVNEFTASTPEVPFGGVKHSGYGRELARFGVQSFTNPKTVWLAD